MNSFLLEVLVQELPYKFIPSAMSQLENAFKNLFDENKIKYSSIKTYATPRRLAVIIKGLDDKKEDITKDIKGPILNIALDENGNHTNAAKGFAKKNGAGENDLYQKDNYIWASVVQKGINTDELICASIKDIILNLQGPHFMRWKNNSEKFSRPIENITALYNNKVLPVEILGIKAVDTTKGHRFSKIKEVKVDIENYVEKLKEANVYVDCSERHDLIIKSAQKKASDENLVIDFNGMEDLLEEVTYITEFPVPVLCEFKKKYLEIPDIVTTTVMSKHQRYFPLYEKDGKLSNKFITMANFVGTDEESFDNIRAGNQRVISARLEDGIFFYDEDTKTSLGYKIENLKGMTFQRNLGTLYDKTLRIAEISKYIAKELDIKDDDIIRAAMLSKADLSTSLVFEFTELQGFIGENYALKSGEKPNVALAIKEHYFPLNALSDIPSSTEGAVISIADKIDTICAVFLSTQGKNKKKRPTGSNDPLGVRRAAIGIIRIITSGSLNINLEKLTDLSVDLISKEFDIKIDDTTKDEIINFILDRLYVMYEKTYERSVLEACTVISPLENIVDYLKRADKVSQFIKEKDFSKLYEALNRIARITADKPVSGEINPNLFRDDAEKVLYDAYKKLPDITVDNMEKLNMLIEPVNNFFDKVLVMDKDNEVKQNRINLLCAIKAKVSSVCDFSKIKII